MLLGVAALLMAGAAQLQAGELGVDVDVTYVSKYIWRGIDRLDDKGAFQPSVNIDLFESGFSMKLWASYAGSSKGNGTVSTVNATEYRYIFAYDYTAFEGESWATSITPNFIYYDFIDEPDVAQDAQEFGVQFAWPSICPAGVVPSYYVGKIWPAKSDSALTGEYSGWVHIFGLGYDLELADITPEATDQVVNLIAAAVYNDGFAGATVDHDWSHILLGASTGIEIGPGAFTPALYYQVSMDDSVNSEDEFWTSLSYKLSF
jgi:hypothetical protein